MNVMNTCQNCHTGKYCRDCELRPDHRSTTDIETQNAAKLMNWMFAWGIVFVAVGLIVLTEIFL